MQTIRKNPALFKYFGVTFICTSAGWVVYQVQKTRSILNNALDTSVLKAMESTADEEGKSSQDLIDLQVLKNKSKCSLLSSLWDSLKFTYARRLLCLASSDNVMVRDKAIKRLAGIKRLDDWHCSLLSNMMDARTAVALARTKGADSRLFLKPALHYANYNKRMLVNELKELLMGLEDRSKHVCMQYFISKVFIDEQDVGRIIDHDTNSLELSKFIHSASDLIPMCLESLLHHASVEEYAHDIVQLNGLPLLMELHTRFKTNTAVSVVLCRIISYMSVFPALLDSIFKSGWVGVLAQWVNHPDIRISIPAARALANLDVDERCVYTKKLFLLHPTMKHCKPQKVDVIFVHGLLGGVFFTWRQRNKKQTTLGILDTICPDSDNRNLPADFNSKKTSDPITKQYLEDFKEIIGDKTCQDYDVVLHDLPTKSICKSSDVLSCPGAFFSKKDQDYTFCWPKDWLADDCRNIRIIGVNYDTSLSMWAPICPCENVKPTLAERSNELITKLIMAGVGRRPIIWVTHSMGGLIVKHMLNSAYASADKQTRDICLNTKAIVFYSTPHLGSRLANLSQATALVLWPSVEVQELREKCPKLVDLHKKFLQMADEMPIKIVTFVETKSTIVTAMKFNFLFVEPESGNPGVGEYYEVPQDHLDICKPLDRYSFLYQKVLQVLREVLEKTV